MPLKPVGCRTGILLVSGFWEFLKMETGWKPVLHLLENAV
jgi:hypothetical protein